MASKLFDSPSTIEFINAWLEKLDTHYSVSVTPVDIPGAPHLSDDLIALTLRDTRTGITVSPADVGYGVSQVMPIVTSLVSSQNSLICIEQPETHLHPRLQSQLADLFIDTTEASANSNQLLVETHSEHILTRLQRRIREGVITSDQVKVLYVDQYSNGSARIQELRLSETGDMLDEWPTGFFDNALIDILEGL